MPSSTSSSEQRSWRRTWVVALALVFAFVASWEISWRLAGFSPSILDDGGLWSMARDEASRAGPSGVIIIGSSRIQLGIDADSFAEATGWSRPIQLALPMGPSLPILRHLSGDPSISGTIVCELNPMLLFDATRQLDLNAAQYINLHAEFGPADAFEARLRTMTQRALVSSLPALYPNQLEDAFLAGRWPRPSHVTTDVDRSARLVFRSSDEAEQQLRAIRHPWSEWTGRPAAPHEVEQLSRRTNLWLRAIRARGGEVVFVRMPTTGEVRAREERLFPRPRYWDVFAARTNALMIHFEDYPELHGFDPPDESHLGEHEKVEFSRALGRIIVRELERRER